MAKQAFFLLCYFLGLHAFASDLEFGLLAGVKYNSASTDITGASVSPRTGIMLGGIAWLPLTKSGFGFRTGGVYNQRFASLGPTNQGDISIRYTYLDIPVTAMLQMDQIVTLFGGPVMALNQSKDVDCTKAPNCSATDVRAFLIPWQIGADFRFAPQFGMEVFYEAISGDLSKNVANMSSIGLAALIFFE